MISYYELLNKINHNEIPDLLELNLNCGKRYYQAYYDDGLFNYYGLCEENEENEDFKYYLSDCLLDSEMFDKKIKIMNEKIEKIETYYDEDLEEQCCCEKRKNRVYIIHSEIEEFFINKINEIIDKIEEGEEQ